MKNETYDLLKKIALVAEPAAVFVALLADIWGLAVLTPVAATISACGVFLGTALVIASKHYTPEIEDESELDEYERGGDLEKAEDIESLETEAGEM